MGGKYEIVGDARAILTFTHLDDVAKSVARLSLLGIKDPKSVPDVVRISGTTSTAYEVAELTGEKLGKTIKVVTIDPETVGKPGPMDWILMLRYVSLPRCMVPLRCSRFVYPQALVGQSSERSVLTQ